MKNKPLVILNVPRNKKIIETVCRKLKPFCDDKEIKDIVADLYDTHYLFLCISKNYVNEGISKGNIDFYLTEQKKGNPTRLIEYKDFIKEFAMKEDKEYIDSLKERVIVKRVPINKRSIEKVIDIFKLKRIDYLLRNIYKISNYGLIDILIKTNNDWNYSDAPIYFTKENYPDYTFINFNELTENKTKENIKMKQVVLEIPNQNFEVSYKWLKEQKCCESAIDWFVNRFGNKASYDDVLKAARVDRTDSKWLEDRKHLFIKNDDYEYVHIDNVKQEKLYILKYNNKFYKACREGNHYFFSDMNETCNGFSSEKSLKADIKSHLLVSDNRKFYEFDSFDDFVFWYVKEKKLSV